MPKIITATGKEFRCLWCSELSVLRFCIVGEDMDTILSVFRDEDETASLTYVFDRQEREHIGFTKFKGVDLNMDNSIVVSLLREN